MTGLLDTVRDRIGEGDLVGALGKLGESRGVLAEVGHAESDGVQGARCFGLLERRWSALRREFGEWVMGLWRRIVVVDEEMGVLVVEGEAGDVPFEEVVRAMDELDVVDTAMGRVHKSLDTAVVGPLLKGGKRVRVETGRLGLVDASKPMDAADFIDDVKTMLTFMVVSLPGPISTPLLERILPVLMLQVVSEWLDPCMPTNLESLDRFQVITTKVEDLAEYLKTISVQLPSEADLEKWLKRIPQAWLAKQKEACLAELRMLFIQGLKRTEMAERHETQLVEAGDDLYGGPDGGEDAWNEDWGDGDGDGEEQLGDERMETGNGEDQDDAWNEDWDDDDGGERQEKPDDSTIKDITMTNDADEDDAGDAWGWGDGDDDESSPTTTKPPSKPTTSPRKQQNGKTTATRTLISSSSTIEPSSTKTQPSSRPSQPSKPQFREITLSERYRITAFPASLRTLINTILNTATTLASPSFPHQGIASALPGLATIPTLLLAMFRATA